MLSIGRQEFTYSIMSDSNSHEAMHMLANSVRRLYNRLRFTSDQLHEDCGLSAPKRTLLMDLRRYGPQTVPALASKRFISRQITQTQVNELLKLGYVKACENPEHKRSKLILLTSTGEAFLQDLSAREQAFMADQDWLPDAIQLDSCIKVLDEIYEQLGK